MSPAESAALRLVPAARPLHVCEACGTASDEVKEALAEKGAQIDTLLGDVENLEHELRSKRAQLARLKKDQVQALKADLRYPDAMNVLEFWKELCQPNARELGGARALLVIARLKGGYAVEDLRKAVWGYSLKPYVVDGKRVASGPKPRWYADAELIFRDAKHVDTGIRLAEQEEDYRSAMKAPEPVAADPVSEGDQNSDMGAAALRMARFGWLVFPCLPREKAPATRNGLLDASTEESKIRQFWSANPEHNVAVRCGVESGIVVLDVDGDEGFDSLRQLEAKYGDLPVTGSVATPRGGAHFYWRHPGFEVRNTAGWPGPGLDIRGDGGYVLAPPSVHPNGRRYELDEEAPIAPVPAWLLTLLSDRQVEKMGVGRDWAQFVSEGAQTGERNNRMTSFVGHLFSKEHAPTEVLELARVLNKNVSPPLTEKDLAAIVTSIGKRRAR